MARDARLALTDDLSELADRQLCLTQEKEQAQPGRVPCRA